MVYIKKVETRGFKSFGTRPVHVNFDGKFIGITGPNGSGKSNIIDAILFALGENKPRMMRVNKLSGLIFDSAGGNLGPAWPSAALGPAQGPALSPCRINLHGIDVSRTRFS